MDKAAQEDLALEEAAQAAREAFYDTQKIPRHPWKSLAEESRKAWRAAAEAARRTYP